MSWTGDRSYFKRREAEERAAALAAETFGARAIHLQMAYRYAARIAAIDHRERGEALIEEDLSRRYLSPR